MFSPSTGAPHKPDPSRHHRLARHPVRPDGGSLNPATPRGLMAAHPRIDAWLQACLERALSRSRQSQGRRFAVMVFDLDRFKRVNDSMGLLAGDDMLVQI